MGLTDRRRLVAAICGGLAVLLFVGFGAVGLIRGHHADRATEPAAPPSSASPTREATSRPNGNRPATIPITTSPEAFARRVAQSLFTWDTASGYGPADYAQSLADVAASSEADALAADVRAYLPTTQAWAQLRQYQTRQWLSIEAIVVPDAWSTAVSQAAPGQLAEGATAYTVTGTRHRSGTWDTTLAETSRPVTFTAFLTCTPITQGDASGGCRLLRLSELDNPLK